jgi:hypothetical protein
MNQFSALLLFHNKAPLLKSFYVICSTSVAEREPQGALFRGICDRTVESKDVKQTFERGIEIVTIRFIFFKGQNLFK